jgi:ABC-2 type transport system permease protein
MAAITLAGRTIARPEEDGGMELLLATPLSRTRFATQRVAATGAALTLIAVVPWLLLLIIVPAIGMDVPLSNVAAASAGLVGLVWCFAGIAFLIGAATGNRGNVLVIAGVIAVATYVARAISGMIDNLTWLKWLSPFHYFIGTDPLHTGWHPAHLAALVLAAAATTVIGVLLFDRRDVGV